MRRFLAPSLLAVVLLFGGCNGAPTASAPGAPPSPPSSQPAPPTADSPHPVEPTRFTQVVIRRAIQGTGRTDLQGDFQVDNAWQLSGGLQVAAGHFTNTGAGAIITLDAEGSVKLVGLGVSGAPGPATIRSENGDLLLISQGLGYKLFNYRTEQVQRSDASGNPLD